MTEDQFWQIIDKSLVNAADFEMQAESLGDSLDALSPDEIAAFDAIYDQKRFVAYRWDLWGAGYLMNGGCSDDGFEYFRAWLISRGRVIYEAALGNPDSLAGVEVGDDAEFEEFGYIARSIYEKKTGAEMPDNGVRPPAEPTGEAWDFDSEDEMRRRLPKLFSQYR